MDGRNAKDQLLSTDSHGVELIGSGRIRLSFRSNEKASSEPKALLLEAYGHYTPGHRRGQGSPVSETARAGIRDMNTHPNPFDNQIVVSYELRSPAYVTMSVFDVRGRWIENIFEGEVDGGLRQVGWDGTDGSGVRLASGLYFIRITSGNHVCFAKVLLQR